MPKPSPLRFKVKSAKPSHRRILRLAIDDLNVALGYRAFVLSSRGPHVITFDSAAFERDDPQTLGHCVDLPDERWVVSIRPELEDSVLLATILHEMGHVLGLDHVRHYDSKYHVMSIGLSTRRRPLTTRTRQRWSAQIAHEAAKARLRAHFAQI
jgi:hypothetical protein